MFPLIASSIFDLLSFVACMVVFEGAGVWEAVGVELGVGAIDGDVEVAGVGVAVGIGLGVGLGDGVGVGCGVVKSGVPKAQMTPLLSPR